MSNSRFPALLWIAAAMTWGAGIACAQDFPHKPIRIVTAEPAGGNDFVARIVAQGMTGPLGQPVIVDNRGGGIISGQIVSKASPDGYTLLMQSAAFWLGPFMRKTPYDAMKDFSPIAATAGSPHVLVVNPALPAHSVKELVDLAKSKPGALNYASTATGGAAHLAGELFKAMAGVDIARIPYKGVNQAVNSLIAGEVNLTFGVPNSVAPHVKSGKLRALGVTSTQPSTLFPGAPTVAATVPGYESGALYAMFAPARTPDAVINRLNREIVRVLGQADVKEKLFNTGLEIVASSPQQLGATVKSEMERMGKVIKNAGIQAE